MDSTDAVRLVRELGPVWGPPVVFLGLIISLVRYRWKYKGARGLALIWDRSFLATFLVGVVILACYFYYRYRWWGLPPPSKKARLESSLGNSLEIETDSNKLLTPAKFTRSSKSLRSCRLSLR